MKLLQLRYFCVIAKYENISKAARELMISQPSLSKSLSLLEEELGFDLFDRSGKYIYLTEKGKIFYDTLKTSLDSIDSTISELRGKESSKSELVVCVEAIKTYLPHLITSFHKEHPDISIVLQQQNARQFLPTNNFDVFFFPETLDIPQSLISKKLFSEEFVLLLPFNHPLASRNEVSLEELKHDPFVFTCPINSKLEEVYRSLCHISGFSPHILLNGSRVETSLQFVSTENCVTILPATALEYSSHPFSKLVCIKKMSFPRYERSLFMGYPGNVPLKPNQILLLNFIEDYFSKFYPTGICNLDTIHSKL